MLFSWIRAQMRNAILAGVHDAVEQIANGDEVPDLAAALESRLRLALPPPAAGTDEQAAPNGRSRRKSEA
jgi:hypothetical protein